MIEYIDTNIAKAPLKEVMQAVISNQPFNSVLNLETHTREIVFGGANDVFKVCLYKNVHLYDMAWSGLFPPRVGDVEAALRVFDIATKPILFGCRAARERAGYLTAVYRMQRLGWTFEDAYKEWKKYCRFPTYWLWKRSLRQWEK